MDKKEYYKKKDHRVTIKRYGFMNWYGYHMYNYPLFKLAVYLIHFALGLILGLILKNM